MATLSGKSTTASPSNALGNGNVIVSVHELALVGRGVQLCDEQRRILGRGVTRRRCVLAGPPL